MLMQIRFDPLIMVVSIHVSSACSLRGWLLLPLPARLNCMNTSSSAARGLLEKAEKKKAFFGGDTASKKGPLKPSYFWEECV